MRQPELVIFDMDDVLCQDSGRRLRALALLADVTVLDMQTAAWDSGFDVSANEAKNQGLEL